MTFTLYIKISVNMQNYWGLEFLRDMGYPLVQNFSVLLFKKKLSDVVWPSICILEYAINLALFDKTFFIRKSCLT